MLCDKRLKDKHAKMELKLFFEKVSIETTSEEEF